MNDSKSIELSGTLDEVISYLQNLKTEMTDKEYTDLVISTDYEYDSISCYLLFKRDETAWEEEFRIDGELNRKKIIEQREREQLATLKAKYEQES